SDMLDMSHSELVANHAVATRRWHKAFWLLERISTLDPSNVNHRANFIIANYWLGDLIRAHLEIEDIFAKYALPPVLQALSGEISMTLGDFAKAKQSYVGLAGANVVDNHTLLSQLDLFIRASELSSEFKNAAMYYL